MNQVPEFIELCFELIVLCSGDVLLYRFDYMPLAFRLLSSARTRGARLISVTLDLAPFTLCATQCLSPPLLLGRTEILVHIRLDTAIKLRLALWGLLS